MSQDKVVVHKSFPVLGLLGVVLVILKVLGEISLPWIWVLAPFWVPWAIVFAIFTIPLLIAAIAALFLVPVAWYEQWQSRRRFKRRMKERTKRNGK